MRGLIGKKLGMTQIFDHIGNLIPLTVIEVGPCTVMAKKSSEGKDGYDAVVLGYGEANLKQMTKPVLGQFKALGVEPKRVIREFRMAKQYVDEVEVGDDLTVEMFQIGDFVDVTGLSKGRGFTGVMKRHNQAGARRTHGVHEFFRHAGSIGMATYPGRVIKGKRMAGQHGNTRVTIQNQMVVGLDPSRNLLFVRGSVPGARNGMLLVRASLKKETKAA